MEGKFICHKDFAKRAPIDLFHKEFRKNSSNDHPESECNRHILFRKRFVSCGSKDAVIRITADDYFKLYINGNFVFQGPPPSYPNAYYFMSENVGKFLRAGENVIAVHTYYQGLVNRVWCSGDMRECFWCELEENGKVILVSDENWKCAEHTSYSPIGKFGYDTGFDERYDSSAREVGFELPDFDDTYWENAEIYKNADYNLILSPIRPLEVYRVDPVFCKKEENRVFLDFGREYIGQLYAEAKGIAGSEAILRYGEELNDDGSVRYEMRCNCRYEERWCFSGGEDELDLFDCKGFRYAELMLPDGAELLRVQMTVRHYPFENKATYTEGNPKLAKVLKLCEDTIHYGVQEAYWDCPTREKGQYLGDSFVAGRAQCILTKDTALLKKAISDFCHTSFICKGLMAVSGSSHMQEIADYSLLFPSLVLWTYKQDGDTDFLRQVFPYVKGVYEYFRAYESKNGLLENVNEKWNLVDWPQNLRDGYDFPLTNPIGDGLHNVINAFWIGFLKAYNEICDALDVCEKAETKKIEQAFISAFFDCSTGLFCDSAKKTHSAVHSNILPLLFEIGTENEETKRRLMDFIYKKKLTSMGVYMAYFALAALVKNGERKKAVALAIDKNAWLNMLAEGGTATFEAWGKEQKENASLFHPWAVAPLIVFADIPDIY